MRPIVPVRRKPGIKSRIRSLLRRPALSMEPFRYLLIADIYRRPKPVVGYLYEPSVRHCPPKHHDRTGAREEPRLWFLLRLFHSEYRQRRGGVMAGSTSRVQLLRFWIYMDDHVRIVTALLLTMVLIS